MYTYTAYSQGASPLEDEGFSQVPPAQTHREQLIAQLSTFLILDWPSIDTMLEYTEN
jgi:hypothetical protein